MKKILLLPIIYFFVACGSEETSISSDVENTDSTMTGNPLSLEILNNNESFVKRLTGTINNSEVEMQLIISADESVRGSYFYKKYKELLPFRGRMSGDGRMKLEVYDITTDIVEYFKGRITNDGQFQGKWFKVEENSKSLDFDLTFKDSLAIEMPKYLAGTYQLDTKGIAKKMTIRNAADGKFQFQISIDSYCSGVIEGDWAYFQNNTDANFYGEENCYVHFEVLNNRIKIQEADCLYYHGMQCSFDGTYSKISDKVNWIDDFYADEDIDSLLDL